MQSSTEKGVTIGEGYLIDFTHVIIKFVLQLIIEVGHKLLCLWSFFKENVQVPQPRCNANSTKEKQKVVMPNDCALWPGQKTMGLKLVFTLSKMKRQNYPAALLYQVKKKGADHLWNSNRSTVLRSTVYSESKYSKSMLVGQSMD